MKKRRTFIFACTGSDCKSNGGKAFAEAIKETINEKPFRGKFKLVKTKCMDCCKSGPVVVIKNELIKKGDLEQLVKELAQE
ncbi:(2Fe-2S) ferredoxin domain-containing protein [Cyclobacterium roseum]|uniref:(2Fe-2S) ferredoxin domain-containing protein n=1 Tax=Cyclobacterium roseum TaxID=2666137 RepID=UPI001391811C|nr:(2Fe-2S) ferredoxin domain-containing protein [Cyclobacterium roseum]